MSDTSDSFEKDLEQLIRLFKKIKDKSRAEQFSHLDPAFAQNLDFIISNYEMVKNNMPKELFSQMGLPFQQMMREFINHLKHELGEDFEEYDGLDEELANEDLVSESSDIGEAGEDIANEIKAIDTRLQKPGLSEDEINNLLDKRHDLLNE
jgi:predicted DNA binding CopG/RHH family protein